jgi:DNA polymerase III delta prime subunit
MFIHKYCPLWFDDYCGQKEVIQTIRLLVKLNVCNILLQGPSHSGKTSLLKSIVAEYFIGCDPYLIAQNILYINNINDQGIQHYRNKVKHFCQICSSIPTKKKIIVLDDIDNVNEQCQHIFRSLLDNYKQNVFFIASTSHIQKVIDNIQSRFTVVAIPFISEVICRSIIHDVQEKENILLDTECIDFIISTSNGNIKNILQCLQKFSFLDMPITINIAMKLCCNISYDDICNYFDYCAKKMLCTSISILYRLHEVGYSVIDILNELLLFVKQTTLFDEEKKYEIIKIITNSIIDFHNIHEDVIELAFLTNKIIALFV